jgi:hypothetical protein
MRPAIAVLAGKKTSYGGRFFLDSRPVQAILGWRRTEPSRKERGNMDKLLGFVREKTSESMVKWVHLIDWHREEEREEDAVAVTKAMADCIEMYHNARRFLARYGSASLSTVHGALIGAQLFEKQWGIGTFASECIAEVEKAMAPSDDQ